MKVSDAVEQRSSTRAFLDRSVENHQEQHREVICSHGKFM
jgi:hypothetical protein